MSTQTLKLAICLYPSMDMLDYIGPLEFLSCLFPVNVERFSTIYPDLAKAKYRVEASFVSHSKEPVEAVNAQKVAPDSVYGEEQGQFDLIMIPGGLFMNMDGFEPSLFKFLEKQVPGAKHVLTICTGSWILAASGMMPPGTKATSNKSLFKMVTAATADKNIQWIPQARWVADDSKKFWSGSGLSAGLDLGYGFTQHLVGPELADLFAKYLEFTPKKDGDDEFAAEYGLV